MTQIRSAPLPTDLARTDASNTWTGTQDFTGATVLGIAGGGSGGGTVAGATATAAGVVQLAGDLAGTYTAPTVPGLAGKADKAALAAVATSGAYTDLTGRPALAGVATSGAYGDLTGRPALATVASSGAYGDLTGRPALATVATSGSYTDLANTPTVPTTYLRVKAAEATTIAATPTTDADLRVTTLPVGTYIVEAFLANANAAAAQVTFGFSTSAGMSGPGWSGVNSGNVSGTWTQGGYMNTVVRANLVGSLIVTTAGLFAVTYQSSAGGYVTGLAAGSWLRLTKLA